MLSAVVILTALALSSEQEEQEGVDECALSMCGAIPCDCCSMESGASSEEQCGMDSFAVSDSDMEEFHALLPAEWRLGVYPEATDEGSPECCLCRTNTTESVHFAVCAQSCDTGAPQCQVPSMFGDVLGRPAICGTDLPLVVRFGLMDLPFGPLLALVNSMFVQAITPPIELEGGVYRIPWFMYMGLNYQTMLLFQGMRRGAQVVLEKSHLCGFLLFNTATLFPPIIIPLTNIMIPLSTIPMEGHFFSPTKRQGGTTKGVFYTSRAFTLFPNLLVFAFAFAQFLCSFLLVVLGFVGILSILHIVLVQVKLCTLLLGVFIGLPCDQV
jgi:hypothetical protein